jgi:hypothetical protein
MGQGSSVPFAVALVVAVAIGNAISIAVSVLPTSNHLSARQNEGAAFLQAKVGMPPYSLQHLPQALEYVQVPPKDKIRRFPEWSFIAAAATAVALLAALCVVSSVLLRTLLKLRRHHKRAANDNKAALSDTRDSFVDPPVSTSTRAATHGSSFASRDPGTVLPPPCVTQKPAAGKGIYVLKAGSGAGSSTDGNASCPGDFESNLATQSAQRDQPGSLELHAGPAHVNILDSPSENAGQPCSHLSQQPALKWPTVVDPWNVPLTKSSADTTPLEKPAVTLLTNEFFKPSHQPSKCPQLSPQLGDGNQQVKPLNRKASVANPRWGEGHGAPSSAGFQQSSKPRLQENREAGFMFSGVDECVHGTRNEAAELPMPPEALAEKHRDIELPDRQSSLTRKGVPSASQTTLSKTRGPADPLGVTISYQIDPSHTINTPSLAMLLPTSMAGIPSILDKTLNSPKQTNATTTQSKIEANLQSRATKKNTEHKPFAQQGVETLLNVEPTATYFFRCLDSLKGTFAPK